MGDRSEEVGERGQMFSILRLLEEASTYPEGDQEGE